MKRLSIITINLNNKDGLSRTINSVTEQSIKDFEFIIIDGGSIDGSVEEIKIVESNLAFWSSEPDNGIYNAMNKGIEKATGEYCLFLNSGDCLYDTDVINKFYTIAPTEDIVIGNATILASSNMRELFTSPEQITFRYLYHGNIPHQATFIKRRLFKFVGRYNENYMVISDWEFIIKAICLNNCSYKHLDLMISLCEKPGISREVSNLSIINEERLESIKNNFKYIIHQQNEIYNLLNTNVGDMFVFICNKPKVFAFVSFILRCISKCKRMSSCFIRYIVILAYILITLQHL